jgi:hypothetical protein
MKTTVHFMRGGKKIAPSRKLTLPLIQKLRDVGVMIVYPATEFGWARGRPPGRHEEHEVMPKKHADETFWMSLSSKQRHRALAAAYPQRDTGGWSISLPIDKRALAQARKLYGKQPKKRGPLPKPKTATPKRGKTKARRKPGALSADELVAEALAALR